MEGRPSVVNVFDGGMWSDFDPQRTGRNTYTNARNVRVIYNSDGTLSVESAKGNKYVLQMGFNYGAGGTYTPIAAIDINNLLIVLSTQNSILNPNGYSEIGIITEQQVGVYSYQTVFNDQYDPNNQRLRLSTRYQIRCGAIVESRDSIRIYWEDDHNGPRVFNVVAGIEFSPTYAPPYPAWYSVHGMDRMCDVQWGLLKYRRNIPGNLTTGKREYFYRLVHKSGYATPWSPGSGLIFVTASSVNTTDWNEYQMSESGHETDKGHELEIKYIDQRFQNIEVACALYETDAAPIRADIIFQGEITGTDMVISHYENTGILPIEDVSQLVQLYADIVKAKTMVINENYLHNANVVFRPQLEIDTSEITIEPMIKRMLSDELATPDTPPLTHQVPKTTAITKPLFAGWNETYLIGDVPGGTQTDYLNYKGTQWEHLFKSNWRESIYGYALVVFDRKGQPMFAQHIGDFKTPPQYSNNWEIRRKSGTTTGTTGGADDYVLTSYEPNSTYQITDTVQQGNNIVINMLGTRFGNIDLTDILYDEHGDLQVSGFSIVRIDRIKDIIAQGLLMNCIGQPAYDKADSEERYRSKYIMPLHSTGNKYYVQATVGGTFVGLVAQPQGQNPPIDHGGSNPSPQSVASTQVIKSSVFTFECPEYMVDQSLMLPDETRDFSLVGNCQAAFLDLDAYGGFSHPQQLSGDHGHFYSKNHHTYKGVNFFNAFNDPFQGEMQFNSWGYTKRATQVVPDVYDDKTKAIPNGYWKIINDAVRLNQFFPSISSNNIDFFSRGHNHSIYAAIEGFRFLGSWYPNWGGTGYDNKICYFISNYRTGVTSYDITDSLLAARVYKNIGHFVPINADTIAAATQTGGRVVFNDVEVWGGDCFPDYFTYCRLLPLYTECSTPTRDYSIGLSFPLESSLNLTMRKGVSYAKDVTRPEATECNDPGSDSTIAFNNGIFASAADDTYRRLEDFNINRVSQATDKITSYKQKGVYFKQESDEPLTEMVSNVKTPGEIYDSFRYFLVNNKQLADSKLGVITDLQCIGMNIYVLQEKGFGRVRFNERTLETTAAKNLTVGTGQGYQGHDYIDFEKGCQNQFSVINTGRSLYWVDAAKGKAYRFGQDGVNSISDLYGQHEFFKIANNYWQIGDAVLQDDNENNYDNPCGIGGISGVFDSDNNSVIWTFTKRTVVDPAVPGGYDTIGTPETIEYSEAVNQFKSFFDFGVGLYMRLKKGYFAALRDTGKLYAFNQGRRGEFFDVFYDSKLKFNTVPSIGEEVIFDNAQLNINPDGYALLKKFTGTTENSLQIVNFNDVNDNRPVYRNGSLVFPTMQIGQTKRLEGKYMETEYIWGNIGDTLMRISSHKSYFRKAYR